MQTIVKLSFAIIFMVHVIFTGLYLLPENPLTNRYKKSTSEYMDQIFKQNWRLFSPEPSLYQIKMFYRCKGANSGWGPWKDPVKSTIEAHQKTRLHGKKLYVYHGIYRNLLNKNIILRKNDNCKSSLCSPSYKTNLIQAPEFKLAGKFVQTLCHRESKVNAFNYKIYKVYPKKFSERKLETGQKIYTLEFDSRNHYASN